MDPASRRGRVSPRALTGRILIFNGAIFVGLSALLGGIALVSQMGTTSATGNRFSMVTGLLALIFAGVGLLEALVGLVVWLFPGGESPPARVVNSFYAALDDQDYAKTFQYLDLAIGGPFSQTMSQSEFVARAQAYDAEHGTITRYSLAAVQASPSWRAYTIKVTRQGNT